MSSAFDTVTAGLQTLRGRLQPEDAIARELLDAIADTVEYWHDINHNLKDEVSRKTPIHARERVDAATLKAGQ